MTGPGRGPAAGGAGADNAVRCCEGTLKEA